MILGCADDRLKGIDTRTWIENRFQIKGVPTIVIYWPGSPCDLINAPPETAEFMINRLLIFFKKRKIVRFIPWQHELCLIYEELLGIVSPKKMYRKQIEDAKKLVKIVEEVSPDTESSILYGRSTSTKRKKFAFHEVT